MFVREMSDELPEQPSPPETQGFDYAALDSETRIVVQQRTGEIKEKIHSSAQATWEIGQKLTDVRGRLKPRQFTFWLQAEFRLSRSTAYNYIKVFESFPICPNFGQISIATSALILLAAPSTPDQARQEALESASHGETITHSKAKAIASRYALPRGRKPVTVDVLASTLERESFTPEHTNSSPDEDESSETEPIRYATPGTNLSKQASPSSQRLFNTTDRYPKKGGACLDKSLVPPSQTVREVVENDTSKGDWNKQEPLEKKREPSQRTNLSIELLDEPNAAEQSEDSLLEEAQGVDCEVLVQPEEIVEPEMAVNPKEERGEDQFEELVGKISDTPIEVVEVTGSKSGKGHLIPPVDGTLVLSDTGRNDSDLADVGDRPNANPPGAKASNKMSEIRKVLNNAQHFTNEEQGDVFELLLYHIGVENLGNLFVKSIHQYEIVNLCHKCFAAMTKAAFSSLEVERINISGLNGSAIEYLVEESKRALSERHAIKIAGATKPH